MQASPQVPRSVYSADVSSEVLEESPKQSHAEPNEHCSSHSGSVTAEAYEHAGITYSFQNSNMSILACLPVG